MDMASVYWTLEAPNEMPLPPSWQQRIDRHSHPQKRQQAQWAYQLLAQVVGSMLETLPEIEVEDGGKPYFPDHPQIYFSLSHTQGAALVAVDNAPVGVDIERVRPVSQHMMERVAQCQDVETFFETWVQREAMGKCLGTGISPLGQVVTSQDVTCESVEARKGYCAAVAQKNPCLFGETVVQ